MAVITAAKLIFELVEYFMFGCAGIQWNIIRQSGAGQSDDNFVS
jgi:hypothetical protein